MAGVFPNSESPSLGEGAAGRNTWDPSRLPPLDRLAEEKALKPIGPERLRALAKAIRDGTYPRDTDVMGGLVRMFRRSPRGRVRS